ncbi:peptidylprolyl isomerase [candidate division KSB1 bacterium]|nr:MAG: peptidylprolyl isomerase [candidate division KSB1 bacterium]
MRQAQNGDTVKVHYTGKLDDGTVFDTSLDREPLEFTIGSGQVIPGFEQAIVGMNPGESKIAKVTAEEAYGPHRKEMVAVIEKNQFPESLQLKVGQQLQIRQENGRTLLVKVTEVSDLTVTLDANHPLAGKELTFDIKLIEII